MSSNTRLTGDLETLISESPLAPVWPCIPVPDLPPFWKPPASLHSQLTLMFQDPILWNFTCELSCLFAFQEFHMKTKLLLEWLPLQ